VDLEQGSIQTGLLDGLRDVMGGDVLDSLQVSNGAGELRVAGVGAGGYAVFLLKTNEPAAPSRDTAADRTKA
jgi:hypothetical protein